MPKYGLTRNQINSRPWDLEAHLLEPSKTITDSVYPSVYLNRIEQMILDSPAMQRLRRIRQLGNSHWVYPSATHSRFSHSLGTLRRTQDLLDAVIGHGAGLHPSPDLFTGLRTEVSAAEFDKYVAEVTVLARLGALLHDMGHIAFGHTIEDNLQLLPSHDSNEYRLRTLWGLLPRELLADKGRLEHHLKALVLSKIPSEIYQGERFEYRFVDDIVNNDVCADLLDYLERDHEGTGLPFAIGERFLDYFYVAPIGGQHGGRLVLQLKRNGKIRQDLVDEVIKILRYRYEETQRVLFHHTKLAADAMLGHLVILLFEIIWRETLYSLFSKDRGTQTHLRALSEAGRSRADIELDLISRAADVSMDKSSGLRGGATVLGSIPLYGGTETRLSTAPRFTDEWFSALNDHTLASLENLFRKHGDDGLLEAIAQYWGHRTLSEAHLVPPEGELPFAASRPAGTGALRDRVADLAAQLLERRLYVEVGECGFGQHPQADSAVVTSRFAERYGRAEARLDLEARVAAFVGMPEEAVCLLWVPDINMQLKPAGIRVDAEGGGLTLEDLGYDDVNRLARRHQRMWGLRVFARRDDRQRFDVMLSWMAREFERSGFKVEWRGRRVPTLWECVRRDIEASDASISAHDLAAVEPRFDQFVPAARGGGAGEASYDDLLLAVRESAKGSA